MFDSKIYSNKHRHEPTNFFNGSSPFSEACGIRRTETENISKHERSLDELVSTCQANLESDVGFEIRIECGFEASGFGLAPPNVSELIKYAFLLLDPFCCS